jgi:colanic acid biosynthesis protein WcaH
MIEQNLYKKIQEVVPIACVDIIVKDSEGKFLLLKRKNEPAKGKWWFVGGRIKKGETLEKAAIRKVKEETELKIISKKILGVDQTIFKKGVFGVSTHTINVIFLAQIKGRYKLKLDNQTSNYKWFKHINPHWHPYIKKFLELSDSK